MSRKPKAPSVPLTAAQHRQEIIKLLRANTYRRNLWDVFGDFVEMGAIAIANAADWGQQAKREARYLEIVQRYETDEVARFPLMLAHLTAALELAPTDVLGSIFSELELSNKATGQFFTPYCLCQLMARMTLNPDEARTLIADRGVLTVLEPAAGAGATVIALTEHLAAHEINYQQTMHVTAVDVDRRAVHMAYLQLSLLHVPAVVIVGNSLTLEEFEHWYTPAHLMGGWTWRLKRPAAQEPAVVLPARPKQGDLFGEEAA